MALQKDVNLNHEDEKELIISLHLLLSTKCKRQVKYIFAIVHITIMVFFIIKENQ